MNNYTRTEKRILDITYKMKSSHLTSCLTALPIIEEIFNLKKPEDKFIQSAGHGALALYVVLEDRSHDAMGLTQGLDAEEIFKHHGTHPDRCKKCGLDYSTGSLGHGIGAAVGMAMTGKNVWCLISDGETNEGSVWEALRIKTELKLTNLKVYCNINGTTALGLTDRWLLEKKLKVFCPDIEIRNTNISRFPFLKEIDAHYTFLDKPI
jgi:transketolase